MLTHPSYLQIFKVFYKSISFVWGLGFLIYSSNSLDNNPLIKVFSAAMLLTFAICSIYDLGFRFNFTSSMAKGVYTLKASETRPLRGDLVSFCLESNNSFSAVANDREYIGPGACANGLKPLLKYLAGLPGDTVEISPDGIILNGSYLVGTTRPEFDSQGRSIPPSLLNDGVIPENMALVISQQHSGSFDSRHFGLVPLESLQKVEPILIQQSE